MIFVNGSGGENVTPEVQEQTPLIGNIGTTLEQKAKLHTNDATATEEDVMEGETFYAQGEKKTGTYVPFTINGIIEQYSVAAGENISAGDFVSFVKDLTTQLDSTSGSCATTPSAVLLSENKVFIAHGTDSWELCGTIVTIDGTSMTAVTSDPFFKQSGYVCTSEPSAVLLSENKVFIAHKYGSHYLYGTIVTIDGTTMTATTTQLDSTSASCVTAPSVVLLSENKVFIAHGYTSNYYLYGTIVTIDGTTMRVASKKNIAYSKYECYLLRPSVVLLSENKVFIAHGYYSSSKYYLHGTIVTIDGTTMTATTTQLDSTSDSCATAPSVVLLSENKVFIAHGYTSNYYLYGTIVTIDGTTMTVVTSTQIGTDGNSSYAVLLSNGNLFINNSHVIIDGTSVLRSPIDVVTKNTVLSPILLSGDIVFLPYASSSTLHGALCRYIGKHIYSDGAIGIASKVGADGETADVYVPSA